ncbi:MAG: hypothetical protein ABIP55_08595 [Tepidisphaeraceae bacterium]
MTRTLLLSSSFLLLFILGSAHAGSPPLFPEGVGSNLVFHELGAYASNASIENWEKDVKVTLLHYHEKQDEVRARLKAMRAGGQSKISLVLWYIQEGGKGAYFSHVICPQNGKIPDQIESNIRNVLKDISTAGYDTVVMRMAAQGLADPLSETYQPARALDSWKLFESLHAACESAIEGTKLKVLYDLGAETMGHPYSIRPGAQAFLKLMWSNYSKKYPASKTVGFSFNHAYDPATRESLRIYEDSGVWPAAISVDIYEDPDRFLGNLSRALTTFGKGGHPLIINETYRNNKDMAKAFAINQRKLGLNFRFLLQWPLDKGAAGHSNGPLTTDIGAYTDPIELNE